MTEMSLAQEQQIHNRVTVSRTTEKKKDTQEIMGEPGILEYLPVCQLFIDQEYQRSADKAQINKIATNWDWRKVKCINVAMRPDLPIMYAVYDGQHTVLAARKRNITTLPCYIIHSDCVKDEASGFVGINRDRKTVNMATQFRAMVIAEDPRAKKLLAILSKHGMSVSEGNTDKPRHTQAISTLLRLLDKNPDRLDDTLAMISAAWQGQNPSLNASFLTGLYSFLYHASKKVGQDDILRSLSRHSAASIQQRAILLGRAKTSQAMAGSDIWREVFLDCYNYNKLKKNRLSLDNVIDEEAI